MKSGYAIHSRIASIPMQQHQTHLRTRPIAAGHLRTFEAVARDWLAGRIDDEAAVSAMAARYARLCAVWDEARAAAVAA